MAFAHLCHMARDRAWGSSRGDTLQGRKSVHSKARRLAGPFWSVILFFWNEFEVLPYGLEAVFGYDGFASRSKFFKGESCRQACETLQAPSPWFSLAWPLKKNSAALLQQSAAPSHDGPAAVPESSTPNRNAGTMKRRSLAS